MDLNRRRFALLTIALALLVHPTARADGTQTAATYSIPAPSVDASVPAEFHDAVQEATLKGILLYRNDTASAVASDAMLDSGALKGVPHPTGWLTQSQDVDGNLWTVAFTETQDGKPFAFADATVQFVDGRPRVSLKRNQPSRPITDMEAMQVQVRDQAVKTKLLHCAPQYNQAVMLWSAHGNLFAAVDLLPARTDEDTYPLGGFHELRYVLKGDAQPSQFSQTKTCVTASGEAANSVALVVTHLTSPTPTQFHVFMSLSYRKTIHVVTSQNNLHWVVEAGRIRLVNDGSAEKALNPLKEDKS